MRLETRIGTFLAVVAFAAGCGSHATEPAGPAAPPVEATPADPAPLAPDVPDAPATGEVVCLPLGTCGCFAEPLCASARVRDDGTTVEFLDGPHTGGTGSIIHECPRSEEPCFDYLDWAQICAVERGRSDVRAKYLCSMDDLRPDFECVLRDGACVPL